MSRSMKPSNLDVIFIGVIRVVKDLHTGDKPYKRKHITNDSHNHLV